MEIVEIIVLQEDNPLGEIAETEQQHKMMTDCYFAEEDSNQAYMEDESYLKVKIEVEKKENEESKEEIFKIIELEDDKTQEEERKEEEMTDEFKEKVTINTDQMINEEPKEEIVETIRIQNETHETSIKEEVDKCNESEEESKESEIEDESPLEEKIDEAEMKNPQEVICNKTSIINKDPEEEIVETIEIKNESLMEEVIDTSAEEEKSNLAMKGLQKLHFDKAEKKTPQEEIAKTTMMDDGKSNVVDEEFMKTSDIEDESTQDGKIEAAVKRENEVIVMEDDSQQKEAVVDEFSPIVNTLKMINEVVHEDIVDKSNRVEEMTVETSEMEERKPKESQEEKTVEELPLERTEMKNSNKNKEPLDEILDTTEIEDRKQEMEDEFPQDKSPDDITSLEETIVEFVIEQLKDPEKETKVVFTEQIEETFIDYSNKIEYESQAEPLGENILNVDAVEDLPDQVYLREVQSTLNEVEQTKNSALETEKNIYEVRSITQETVDIVENANFSTSTPSSKVDKAKTTSENMQIKNNRINVPWNAKGRPKT